MRSLTLAVLLLTLPLFAGSIAPMDLAKLDSEASLIITGRVTAVRSLPSRGLSTKIATVTVVSVLRGEYRERTLKLRTRVGLVHFDRELAAGDGGVLFLKPSDEKGLFEAAYPGSFALFQRGSFQE